MAVGEKSAGRRRGGEEEVWDLFGMLFQEIVYEKKIVR